MRRDEESLVRRFQKGEEKAFNELVSRYKQRIFDMILKMVRNKEDAKDLSQETFVKVYYGLKNFRSESSFFTWITRIALNLCINFQKREKFRNFVSFFDLKKPILIENSSSPDVEKDELMQAIDQAVLSLPSKQRGVFVLRYYQKLPYLKIAEILGKSEGGIKSNYFHAVNKLKKMLAQYKKF
ncbi:MAG: sigma-70 family RNA polymerase sigma factor [Candidatus Zixiibacteriota bacterium]